MDRQLPVVRQTIQFLDSKLLDFREGGSKATLPELTPAHIKTAECKVVRRMDDAGTAFFLNARHPQTRHPHDGTTQAAELSDRV